MKLNISDPTTGASKVIDIEDEKKYHIFFDKRLSQEVDASPLGEEFQGYVLKITGGSDKQGFGMKQGVLVNHRVRLLLNGRTSGFHPTRKDGQRRRKTVRGCIVAQDIAVLDCVVVRKGNSPLVGITDKPIPNRLGPKRASKIRRLFNLTKEDNVCQYVIRRTIPAKKEGGKAHTKAPKVQRLVTPQALQRKRHLRSLLLRRYKKAKADRKEYAELLNKLRHEKNTAKAQVKKAADEHAALKKERREEAKKLAEKKRLATEEALKKKEAAMKKKTAPPKKAAEKKPVEKKPAEKKPVEKKPAEKKPVEKKPAEKKPVEKKPAAKKVTKK